MRKPNHALAADRKKPRPLKSGVGQQIKTTEKETNNEYFHEFRAIASALSSIRG